MTPGLKFLGIDEKVICQRAAHCFVENPKLKQSGPPGDDVLANGGPSYSK